MENFSMGRKKCLLYLLLLAESHKEVEFFLQNGGKWLLSL